MTLPVESRNTGGPFEFVVAAEADLATINDPKVGQFALALAEGSIWFHTGSAWQAIGGGGGAPASADYLVGTTNAGLSAEIVVGTSPGGELGGTWASPTVDATHAGSAHHAQAHSGADHTDPGVPSTVEIGDAAAAGTGTNPPAADDHIHAVTAPGAGYPLDVAAAEADGTAVTAARSDHVHAHGSGYAGGHTDGGGAPTGVDYLVGTADATLTNEIVVGTAPGGELGGTWASPTVDATHSGSAHHAQSHSGADHTDPGAPSTVEIGDAASAGTGTNPPAADDHIHAVTAPGAGYPLDTTFAAESDGTAVTAARSDHRHTITDPTTLPGNIDLDSETSAEGSATDVARADHTHGIATDDNKITIGAMFHPAPASTGRFVCWRAPFNCTVTNVRGYVDAGTTTQINAFRGSYATPTDFLATDNTIGTADTWDDGGAVQNTAVTAGDAVGVEIAALGTATKITIEIDLTRP